MNEKQHPIQGLMYTAMTSIKEMIDVNTIVGEAVEAPDGTIIIPISKVGVGFAVGGADYREVNATRLSEEPMFGGGTGTGVSIAPMAFLVVGGGQVKLLPVNVESNTYDKIIEAIPGAIDKVTESITKIKTKNSDKSTNNGLEAY